MKQYLLSVHSVEGDPQPPQEAMAQMYKAVARFNQRLQADGAWVFAGGLYPADSATVVRTEAGEVVTTDGPFGQSKEHLGGFWVIAAADLDEALRLAADASAACQGAVEVRPFQDEPAG